MQILLVEDNPINLLMAQGTLSYLGHEVTAASNGAEAVAAAKLRPFDLILMDLMMPVMDGYQASAEILAHCQALGQAPPAIVALSASLGDGEKEQCREHGITRWISKPISPDEFQDLTQALNLSTDAPRPT
jgi:CheY-like chemotaxis protein